MDPGVTGKNLGTVTRLHVWKLNQECATGLNMGEGSVLKKMDP